MNRPEGYPKISVIICALNEEENLPYVLPKIPGWVDEIMLVDGHSADNTIEVAKEIRPEIKVLYQPGKGKGDALRHGIKHASGDIIVTLDADGETDPKEMPRFIEPLFNGYDFTKGSRFLDAFPRNKPWHRILGNWVITITFNILFFRKYTDLCSGYNAFRRAAIEQVNPWPPDGFENEPFINCRIRKKLVKVKEIGYEEQRRLSGDIKEQSWRQGFKAIKTIIRERFRG